MSPRARGYLVQLVVYVVALLAAAAVVAYAPIEPALWRALAADVVATVVVFAFSVGFSNSSLYDPYWSVAPPALFAYWAIEAGGLDARAAIAGALVAIWAARLTWNFLRGFPGLHHEDWRYPMLRERTGRAYWLVSFLGIHFFPTLMTFAGSVSLYVVLTAPTRPLGALDGVAAVVTALGIFYEATADEQLRRYVRSGPPKGEWLRRGLWRHTRHPNYFGEVTFWCGLFLFAVAADPTRWWWAAIGPASILALFLFVSIPMIDARMVERRPGYAAYMRRVSRLVPWFVGPEPRE